MKTGISRFNTALKLGTQVGRQSALGFTVALALVSSAVANADAPAEPLQQSNTVKSSELITDFLLAKDASENEVVGTVNLFRVGQGERGPTLLQISADEVITFSVNDTSVVCLQNVPCRLPFFKGASYRSEFKRFNGEIVKNETLLPEETKILSPAENTLVKKDDAVRIEWVVSRPEGPRGISLSIFLGEQIKTCSTNGWVSWDTEGTATVPAKYVTSCRAPLRARFNVFYANINPMPGVAGGTLKGYSTARVFYSYVDPTFHFELDKNPLSLEDLREIDQGAKSGDKVTQTIRR